MAHLIIGLRGLVLLGAILCIVHVEAVYGQNKNLTVKKVKEKKGKSVGHHSIIHTFKKGTKVVQGGVGIGFIRANFNLRPQIPPVMLAAEYGFSDKIGIGHFGIGMFAGFSAYTYNGFLPSVNASWRWRVTNVPVGVRLAYHIYTIENLDLYGGLWAGYAYRSIRLVGNNNNANLGLGSAPAIGLLLGARYYVNSNLGVLFEVGSGFSLVQIGLAYRW